MTLKRQPTANGKCTAKTKSGGQCAAPAVRGSTLCAIHADPQRAAELGRKGGARNRKLYGSEPENVSVPQSTGDVKRMLAEAMAETRAGKMDPKLGSTLAYIATALLRAYEADPPPPPNPPTIYGALRFKTYSTGMPADSPQKELPPPGNNSLPALSEPTIEVEVAPSLTEVVILDY